MKSNREFLDGVYSKAEALQNETKLEKKNPKMYYRFASIAAIIILIPTILFWKTNSAYEEISAPMAVRMVQDPSTYFAEADYILIGETESINESIYLKDENYIYTDINIKIMELLKGEIDEEEIALRVSGGIVKKEKIKSNMDSEFVKGKISLVFLLKDEQGYYNLINSKSQFKEVEKDLYVDEFGNEYSLEEIKNTIMEE